MKILKLIIKYLRYKQKSVTRYKIHSPFVFEFAEKVLHDHSHYNDYKKIDEIRKSMHRNNRSIELIDFGAGAKTYPYSTYIRKIKTIAKRTEQPLKYSNILYRIASFYRPANILELGTSLGLSTMNFALGNPDSKIISVEGCASVASVAEDNFKKLGIENIRVIIGNFDNTLPKLLEKEASPDLVFFDGNHRKDKTLDYFNLCLKKVNNNTIFVFDDIHWSAGMEEAWEIIKSHAEVKVTIDLFLMGIVFFRKELSKQDFMIRY